MATARQSTMTARSATATARLKKALRFRKALYSRSATTIERIRAFYKALEVDQGIKVSGWEVYFTIRPVVTKLAGISKKIVHVRPAGSGNSTLRP